MSTNIIHIACQKCGLSGSQAALIGEFVYLAEPGDDRTCNVSRELGYCERCGKFQAIERLDPAELQGEMRKVENEKAKLNSTLESLRKGLRHWLGMNKRSIEYFSEQLEYWKKRQVGLEFHQSICVARKDGPKCLECGSNQVTPIALPSEGLDPGGPPVVLRQVHPGCGGTLEASQSMLRFMTPGGKPKRYNTKGERLASLSSFLFD